MLRLLNRNKNNGCHNFRLLKDDNSKNLSRTFYKMSSKNGPVDHNGNVELDDIVKGEFLEMAKANNKIRHNNRKKGRLKKELRFNSDLDDDF